MQLWYIFIHARNYHSKRAKDLKWRSGSSVIGSWLGLGCPFPLLTPTSIFLVTFKFPLLINFVCRVWSVDIHLHLFPWQIQTFLRTRTKMTLPAAAKAMPNAGRPLWISSRSTLCMYLWKMQFYVLRPAINFI